MDASEKDFQWWMNVAGMTALSCRQPLSAWERGKRKKKAVENRDVIRVFGIRKENASFTVEVNKASMK
jgi:hypothetical protein